MPLIRANKKVSNKIARIIPLPILRAIYGFLLSFGAPLGWLIVQALAGRPAFTAEFFDPLLYGYLTLATAIVFSGIGYVVGRREQMITRMALTDGLTSLYNKRYFKSRLDQEFVRFQRDGTNMSIIQIDLDFFKRVNDTYGHHAGDEVLKNVSAMLMAHCRKNEIAARVGGEELAIIACGVESQDAAKAAERIRLEIENSACSWQGEEIKITASFGVASANKYSDNPWQVYQKADEALYQAKHTGRNRVCISENKVSKNHT